MSDTPRTDKLAFDHDTGDECFAVVKAEFAKQLESQLAETRAEIERLTTAEQAQLDMLMSATGGIVTCHRGSKHAVIDKCLYCEIDRKDELIKQMLEALEKCAEHIHYYYQEHSVGNDKALELALEAIKIAKGGR